MSKEYSYKHINIICPECKSEDILVDDFHQETYCINCGLVLQDNTIFKITRHIEEEKRKNQQVENIWRQITNANIFKVVRK